MCRCDCLLQVSSPGDAGLNPELTPNGLERRCCALLITAGVTCFHFDNDSGACESVLKHFRAVAEAPYKYARTLPCFYSRNWPVCGCVCVCVLSTHRCVLCACCMLRAKDSSLSVVRKVKVRSMPNAAGACTCSFTLLRCPQSI